jgi:hypothetical protein
LKAVRLLCVATPVELLGYDGPIARVLAILPDRDAPIEAATEGWRRRRSYTVAKDRRSYRLVNGSGGGGTYA